MPVNRRKIFIGSTSRDLKQHRLNVREVVDKLKDRFEPITMDVEFGAADHPDAVKISLDHVDEADIYIGLFAFRYGYVPTKDNPDEISITEMEFKRAGERGIPRYCFFADDEAAWRVEEIEIDTIAKQKLDKLKSTIGTELIFGHFSANPQSVSETVWHTLNKIKDIHEVPYVVFAMTEDEFSDMWETSDSWLQAMDAQWSLKGKLENLKVEFEKHLQHGMLKTSYAKLRSHWTPLAYSFTGTQSNQSSISEILQEITDNINTQYKTKQLEIQLRDYSEQFFSEKQDIRNRLLPQLEQGCIFVIDGISLFHPKILKYLRTSDWLISRSNTSVLVALPFGVTTQPVNQILLSEFHTEMVGTRHRFQQYLDLLCEIGVTEIIQFKRLFSSMLPHIVEVRSAQTPLASNLNLVRQYGDQNNLGISQTANLIFGGNL